MHFSEKLFHRLVDYETVHWDGRTGGVHLPQRSGNQHGDLKPEAAGASVLCKMSPAAFSVFGNRMLLPSVDKGTHGRKRVNFCPCCVAFVPRTGRTLIEDNAGNHPNIMVQGVCALVH